MKKWLKILLSLLVLAIIALVAIPYLFKDRLAQMVKDQVNAQIHAEFDFDAVDLSLLTSFPKAELELQGVHIINKAPFAGDTLFAANKIDLAMGLTQLFGSDGLSISKLALDGGKVNVLVDAQGNANYDIAKSDTETTTNGASGETSGNTELNLQYYEITDSRIVYNDATLDFHLVLDDFNHKGSGDLSALQSELITETNTLVSLTMDKTQYLNKNSLSWNAVLGMDLETNTYTFKENKALINRLPLVFDGFVQLLENGQKLDISFKAPSTDFANFLALIPEKYTADISGVKTSGNFEVSGFAKGVMGEETIPAFSIDIVSENASFKYPELPKSVENIRIDTHIGNKTGRLDDTYVDVNTLDFSIGQDRFKANASVRQLMQNPIVKSDLVAHMDLGGLSQAYPMPTDLDLKGRLDADMHMAFDMASIEKEQYEKTELKGEFALRDFEYADAAMKNPVQIQEAALAFTPQKVDLQRFQGKTGQSDFNASGSLENFLGFMFRDEALKGDFTLNSNTLSVLDFMMTDSVGQETPASETGNAEEQPLKIPAFLDCTVKANAAQVLYDNLSLTQVSAEMRIKDQTVRLSNVKSNLLGGKLSFNGLVATQNETPNFDMELQMDGFEIGGVLQNLELFKMVAPIAKVLEGSLDSKIKLSGDLKSDFTPNLAKTSGDIWGQLVGGELKVSKSPIIASLDNELKFLDLSQLNVKDLQAAFSFQDGAVAMQPIQLAYKDIPITISGKHSLDAQMGYNMQLEVPAKYLGDEVNKLLGQLGDESTQDLKVPVNAVIGGSLGAPEIKTDLASATKNLTKQLVDVQKKKLLDKGTQSLTDLLGGSTPNDSTETNTTDVVSDVLSSLGGAKKDTAQTKDSVPKEDAVKKATDVLGGLFGKKKKKDSTNQ